MGPGFDISLTADAWYTFEPSDHKNAGSSRHQHRDPMVLFWRRQTMSCSPLYAFSSDLISEVVKGMAHSMVEVHKSNNRFVGASKQERILVFRIWDTFTWVGLPHNLNELPVLLRNLSDRFWCLPIDQVQRPCIPYSNSLTRAKHSQKCTTRAEVHDPRVRDLDAR